MRRLILTVFVLSVICGVTPASRAEPQTKEDRLKAVKAACAIVEIRDGPRAGMRGSAFAVGRSGYFVTAFTYEFRLLADTKVWVTQHPGEPGEKRSEGRVLRRDQIAGFMVVRANGADEVPAVTVGDSDKVEDLEDLTAFGMPFFEFAKLPVDDGRKRFPPNAIAEQKITVAARILDGNKKPLGFTLSKPGVKGKLLIGGPVVNDAGELIGLVAGDSVNTQPPAAFGTVLSVKAMNALFAAAPVFEIEAPEIDPKGRFDKAPVRAVLVAGFGKPEGFSAEMTVRSGGRERKAEMKAAGDGFEAGVAPFEKTERPELLTTEIAFPDSRPRLPVADAAFKVGGKEFRLSDVTRVRFGKGGGVNTLNGPVDGEVTGLDLLAVQIGEQAFTLKTAAATELAVRLSDNAKNAYRMTAVAKKDGKEVARAEAIRFLKGTAPSGLDGLRMGHMVEPAAGGEAKTFARILVAGDDESRETRAEQMVVTTVAAVDEKGKPIPSGIPSGMVVTLHPTGWTALTGDPLRPGFSNPLFRLEFGTPSRKPFVAGEWRNTMIVPNDYTPYLSMLGRDVPVMPGDGWGGRGRESASATFAVYELEADKDGKLVKLAVDFIYNPPGRPDKPVMGVIRVNSKLQ